MYDYIITDQGPKLFLTAWKNKVGHENAERIKNVCSIVEQLCTSFLKNISKILVTMILSTVGKEARFPWPKRKKSLKMVYLTLANIMARKSSLYYPGPLYAGSTDFSLFMHNGMETIVDFKQANRPKREGMDRRLLSANCSICHGPQYDVSMESTKIEKQGVIMVCTPDFYITKNL